MIKKEKPVRSKSGIVAITTSTNKKYLVKDFAHRCAYCDDIDVLGGGYRFYQVDHFAPKAKFKNLEFVYDNLLYTCPWCNRAKWDIWPSNSAVQNIVGHEGFVDPCTEEYYVHLDRNSNGSITWLTPLGKYMYQTIHLFLKRHEIIYNLDRIQDSMYKLEKSIKNDEQVGKDSIKKKEILESIKGEFFIYYYQWYENEKANKQE